MRKYVPQKSTLQKVSTFENVDFVRVSEQFNKTVLEQNCKLKSEAVFSPPILYVVITGASSGIGWEAAKAFSALGKNLILVARRKENLEKLKREILESNPTLEVVIKCVNLSCAENLQKFYDEIKNLPLETWINCAGFGNYQNVAEQDLQKVEEMISVNITAVTILSSLFVRDFKDCDGTQLINISSAGGYTIVPNAVTYCATKFFVGAFTEGLAYELKNSGAKMQAKILAPAATKTEFGKIATGGNSYNYDERFGVYHTARQMAEFLIQLYKSDKMLGIVDRETFEFSLCDGKFNYAGNSKHNQK